MKVFERKSGALTHRPMCGGEIRQRKNSRCPLLLGVSHKFSAVSTKTSSTRYFLCLCESDTTHERTESAGAHPPPTNLQPPPCRSIKDTHTHIPISAHLAFQLLPHFSSPLLVDSLSLSFSPSSPLLEDEERGRVCVCVYVC